MKQPQPEKDMATDALKPSGIKFGLWWNKSQEDKGDWKLVAEDEDDDCLAVVLILAAEAKT